MAGYWAVCWLLFNILGIPIKFNGKYKPIKNVVLPAYSQLRVTEMKSCYFALFHNTEKYYEA